MSVPLDARRISKTITFDGLSGTGLSSAAVPVFTVSGPVLIVALVPYCVTDLASAGGGTLALGVTGSTALFLAATTATAIDQGEFWTSTTPTAKGVALPAALKDVVTDQNVIGTIATADITAGVLRFDCLWLPLLKNASLTA